MQLELFDHEMLQSPFELKLAEKNTACRDINYINIQNRIDKTATHMPSKRNQPIHCTLHILSTDLQFDLCA